MSRHTGNRFAAFLQGKCPRCQTGQVFSSSLFSPNFRQVNETCPHCKVKFQSEPGFFWGAMYFSYALVVGLSIVMGVIFYSIYKEPPLLLTSGTIIGTAVLLMPFNLRLSRLLMIYVAAPYRKYDKRFAGNLKNSN